MGCDTCGKIKGFVRHEDILNFIKRKWDINAKDKVEKYIMQPISELDWKYKFNEHSEDNENWYTLHGFISFKYNEEERALLYDYDNINQYENFEYYSKYGLREMVESEITFLSLGYWGSSVEIITEIVKYFGGGWVNDNDCDDEKYYPVEADK